MVERALRRERVFKDRYNPLESLTEPQFMELYRLRKATVAELINMGVGKDPLTKRSHSIPQAIQICATLNILATSGTIRKTGELLGRRHQTVLHFFWNIVDSLNQHATRFISFPTSEELHIAAQFYKIGHIPNVVGCVDGSFIAIKRHHNNEHMFVCRQGYHALNVLVVNRADLSFSYINAKFPGSAHDAYVYQMSALRDLLSQQ